MATKDSTEGTVVLLESEWDEIEAATMGFHAALQAGVEDEGVELVRSVYLRISRAVQSVNERLQAEG